jgi:predicted nucleic acid-binding protein
MIVVDASVWVSSLIVQDVNHQISRTWLDQYTLAGGFVAAPLLLLAEVAGAVSRRFGDQQRGRYAANRLTQTTGFRLMVGDRAFGQAAARLAADLRLRGADATYVTLAYRLRVPLVTWDQEQLQRAAGVITVQAPV